MPRLVEALNLKGNPFEHYVAESEPNIDQYAVKPPYFEAIEARATNRSSFILFGDRGAGKSATRLTVFKEIWARKAKGERVPLVVNLVDFSVLVKGQQLRDLTEETLIKEVAFVVIESILTWLSSLEDDERDVYVGALNDDESRICYQLLRDHYLSRPEGRRERSVHDALLLFNQAFAAKSRLWIERRWEPIARLIGRLGDFLARKYVSADVDVSGDVVSVLRRDHEEDFDSVLLLRRLVGLAAIFGFSGIVLLVDKVDETAATNNSADQTAKLVYPILSRVQLMEVPDFSWIFFLWQRVKSFFETDDYRVRLDKVGHATVSWDDEFFILMLDRRVRFFSDDKLDFAGLISPDLDIQELQSELVRISMRSPREMIRLLDVIIREHDVLNVDQDKLCLLNHDSIQSGLDKYVKDVISTVYGERLLAQIFRLNRAIFTNNDVQYTFRVGAQSARRRIQSWENAGIIKLTGTRAAEGAQGGKPANEYTITDSRVERVMRRQLIYYDNGTLPDDDGVLAREDQEVDDRDWQPV
ncbi:MAG TPA: hypothetical protein PKA13_15155 [Geminicoccaceae bacterium]|nr:hypothetical protein [Geminicoccus sp.]HMU51112.1 hypothetical protein [Geminicoccaceae bacterium]